MTVTDGAVAPPAKVASSEMANAIARRYGLGEVTDPMTLVDRGVMGRVWRLPTSTGRFAAKTLLRFADDESIQADVTLQEAALAAGVDLPRPLRSTAGNVVETFRDRDWRVYEWRDFDDAPKLPVDVDFAAAVGAVLARLHGLRLPAPDQVTGWFTQPPTPADWRNLLARAKAGKCEWAPLLAEVSPLLIDVGEVAVPPEDETPTILCHRDVTPDNVRAGGELPTVLDWENAGPLEPLSELGYVLIHWCHLPDGDVDAAGAAALADRYFRDFGSRPALDLSLFAAGACSWLNFIAGTVNHAIKDAEPENREFRLANLRRMLGRPLTRDVLEQLLAAVR